jgi:dinuclear metal center YbgI/SA1388 family protein
LEIAKFIEVLSAISPEEKALKWDKGGTQILFRDKPLEKVLIALDVTEGVIDEALHLGANLILTHHPIFFLPLNKIDENDYIGRLAIKLIQNKISVYSAHTSFDNLQGGNNDYLCRILGIIDTYDINVDNNELIGKIGYFERSFKLNDIIGKIKNKFDINEKLNVVFKDDKLVRKVAICSGSGGSLVQTALENECDLLITGDIDYHTAIEANGNGLKIIDMTHYHSEKIFINNIADLIKANFNEKLSIVQCKLDQNPFHMI